MTLLRELAENIRQFVATIGATTLFLGRVLSQFLPLVNAADWMTFILVAAGLAGLAIWACYMPARRATRVPVMTALRHE